MAHYLKKEYSRAHEVALAVATNKRLSDPPAKEGERKANTKSRMKFDDEEYYVRTRAEMAERFSDELLDVTLEIADKCRREPLELDMNYKHKMPRFPY